MDGIIQRKNELIRIEGLGKTFTSKSGSVTALKNINLSIYSGEIFGIIGLSGAGKSTLVRCINFLERPTEGDVIFDGESLSSLTPAQLRIRRRSMGMIFQQFNLLMQRTALANITFPLEIAGVPKERALERARELLQIVGLADREKAYPSQLSGGQKQRIAIARALATEPKVLLCDEATSALDPTTTASILALIKDINLKLGITVIIITHEMSVIEEICSRVAIIDHSKIAEVGDVDEIFIRPKSEIARKLIFPEGPRETLFNGEHCVRIVFDGKSSFEPVIANLILECQTPVNILYANTKNVNGTAMGQMLLQLPESESSRKRVLAYLTVKGIPFTEETIRRED